MRRLISLAAVVPLLFVATAAAQTAPPSRWSVEVSGDAAFPTRELAGAELRTGAGFGANVRYRLQPHLAAYAGWEWHVQQTKQLVPGQTLDLNDNGYTFGLRFDHPVLARTNGWLRAGAMVNHIEIEQDDGSALQDTKHGLGWEAGAGLSVPLTQRLSIAPGVRFRTLSRDITVNNRTQSSTLSYVTTGVGLVIAF